MYLWLRESPQSFKDMKEVSKWKKRRDGPITVYKTETRVTKKEDDLTQTSTEKDNFKNQVSNIKV